MFLDRLTDTQFAWLLILVFVVTFCLAYSRVKRWLFKRWPPR